MENRSLGGTGPPLRVSGHFFRASPPPPPLSRVPLPLPSYSPHSIRELALAGAVVDLREKAAIEQAPSTPGYYSRLFVTPKVTGRVATGDRSLAPQPLDDGLSLSYDIPVGSPVSQGGGLDGVLGPPGRLPPGSSTSIFASVPEVLRGRFGLSVPRPLFWPFDGSAAIHSCHVPGLLDNASLRVQDPPLPGRLAHPGILVSGDCAGEGLSAVVVSGAGNPCQPVEEFLDSHSVNRLSRDEDSDFSFEGFPDSQTGSEAVLSSQSLPVLPASSCFSVASTAGSDVLGVLSGSGCPSPHEIPSAVAECGGLSDGG